MGFKPLVTVASEYALKNVAPHNVALDIPVRHRSLEACVGTWIGFIVDA